MFRCIVYRLSAAARDHSEVRDADPCARCVESGPDASDQGNALDAYTYTLTHYHIALCPEHRPNLRATRALYHLGMG